MSDNEWVAILDVYDRLEAEILKEAMEAQDIPVQLFQEGISHYLYPVSGPIGRIQVCVPRTKLPDALIWLDSYKKDEIDSNNFDTDSVEE